MRKLWIVLILFLHLALLTQIEFTAWPEMLSYPYLLANGFTLYKDFVYPYPPTLTIILFGVFSLFGFKVLVLQLFTWCLILVTDLVLFFILKKTGEEKFSLIFLTIYVLLQSFLDGNMLWFDYATVLPLLASFLCFIQWIEGKKLKYLFLTGLFLALTITIKQVGIFYLGVLFIYYIFERKISLKEIGILILGGIVVFLPTLLLIAGTNSLNEFWKWTVYYPVAKWSSFPGYVALKITKREILVLLLLFSPLLGIFFNLKHYFHNKFFIVTILFLLAAIIAIYPRFSLFHFQPALAFLTIIAVIICKHLQKKYQLWFVCGIILTSIAVMLLVTKNFTQEVRFYAKNDQKFSEQIINRIHPSERIFLLGSISSQYVFTRTVPPTHWSDNFGWYLEIPGVQEWMLEGFYKEPPAIIFRNIPGGGNWYDLGVYQPQKIVEYINIYYDKKEIIQNNIEVWIRKN